MHGENMNKHEEHTVVVLRRPKCLMLHRNSMWVASPSRNGTV